jgi:hypothetical protein
VVGSSFKKSDLDEIIMNAGVSPQLLFDDMPPSLAARRGTFGKSLVSPNSGCTYGRYVTHRALHMPLHPPPPTPVPTIKRGTYKVLYWYHVESHPKGKRRK